MSIYTYGFSKSISDALEINFIEEECFSDQVLHEKIKKLNTRKDIPPVFKAHLALMQPEERKLLTKAANDKKRGMKESDKSRGIKSTSQKKRWSNANEETRKDHGLKSRNGISEEKKKTQTLAAIAAYSPAREKNRKKPLIKCPHCDIVGGMPAMKRFHFERCKQS